MPTSFESLHDETRPLRMLEEPPGPNPVAVALGSVMLLVLPVLVAILL